MQFNVAKCHVMHVVRGNNKHSYSIEGAQLARTEEERDIGVVVSDNLKPVTQCKKAAQTANVVNPYKQYVRQHLEFAVAVWSPWTAADTSSLERVQQKAVKAISGLKAGTYEERLAELGLPSLMDRRSQGERLRWCRHLSW